MAPTAAHLASSSLGSHRALRALAAALTIAAAPVGCSSRSLPRDRAPGAKDGGPDVDLEASASDAGETASCGGRSWKCRQTRKGKTSCQLEGVTAGGLPPGGKAWECQAVHTGPTSSCGPPDRWVCHGQALKAGRPPGGCGWRCERVVVLDGRERYRCTHAFDVDERPPNTEHIGTCSCTKPNDGSSRHCATCYKSSWIDGTRCYVGEEPNEPVGSKYMPLPDERCTPGTRRWCSGLQYGPWGQVRCLPSARWATVVKNGRTLLDCRELSEPRRPDSLCACYSWIFDRDCCERPDCIVPAGTNGRVCPKSRGRLCDPCNPQKPECVEPHAACLRLNSGQAICGRSCDADPDSCPKGYHCLPLPRPQNGSRNQCIPDSYRCYP